VLLDQSNFPGSIPPFQSLLTPDRVFGIIELFEIHQSANLVFLREAFCHLLPDAQRRGE
jgi:hypothetical protein